MLAWYLRDFADRRGVEHVQVELTAENKIFDDLQAEVETLRLSEEEFEKKQVKLQLELGEAKQQLDETTEEKWD